MKSTVILRKKKPSDEFGYLTIRYFNGSGEKKTLALGDIVTTDDFKKLYNKEFKQFKPNSKLAHLNKKISDKIDDYSIFDTPKKSDKKVEVATTNSFLEWYENNNALILNQSTKKGNQSALKQLREFKTFKKQNDILFTDITEDWVIEFKNYLLTKVSANTAKQYLIVIKSTLNKAKRKKLYCEDYNYFSKLNIKETYSNKKILTENDINTLFEITDWKNKFYDTKNMLLLSVFASGLRVSDIFFIRNKDFRKEYLEVIMKKNMRPLRIPYNEKLIDLLLLIYQQEYLDASKYLSEEEEEELGYAYAVSTSLDFRQNKHKEIGTLERLLKHITTLPHNDYMFKDFMKHEPSLENYDKKRELTEEQDTALGRLRGRYNMSLKLMIKKLDLDIENISSHTGRYSWTNMLIDMGVNILEISRSLGHKRISITERYLEKNFGLEKMENIGSKLSDKFIV